MSPVTDPAARGCDSAAARRSSSPRVSSATRLRPARRPCLDALVDEPLELLRCGARRARRARRDASARPSRRVRERLDRALELGGVHRDRGARARQLGAEGIDRPRHLAGRRHVLVEPVVQEAETLRQRVELARDHRVGDRRALQLRDLLAHGIEVVRQLLGELLDHRVGRRGRFEALLERLQLRQQLRIGVRASERCRCELFPHGRDVLHELVDARVGVDRSPRAAARAPRSWRRAERRRVARRPGAPRSGGRGRRSRHGRRSRRVQEWGRRGHRRAPRAAMRARPKAHRPAGRAATEAAAEASSSRVRSRAFVSSSGVTISVGRRRSRSSSFAASAVSLSRSPASCSIRAASASSCS